MDQKEKIKKELGVKRWSVRCERLKNFLDRYDLSVDDVDVFETSDFSYMKRYDRVLGKYRDDVYVWDILGHNGFGYYVYVRAKK